MLAKRSLQKASPRVQENLFGSARVLKLDVRLIGAIW